MYFLYDQEQHLQKLLKKHQLKRQHQKARRIHKCRCACEIMRRGLLWRMTSLRYLLGVPRHHARVSTPISMVQSGQRYAAERQPTRRSYMVASCSRLQPRRPALPRLFLLLATISRRGQLVGSAAATHLLGIASLVPMGAYAANQPGGKHHAVVHTIACSRHRSVIRLRQSPQANTMSPTTPPLTW